MHLQSYLQVVPCQNRYYVGRYYIVLLHNQEIIN